MKSKTGKKTKTTAIALALALVLALGSTAAFLTAKSDVVTNEFEGAVAININETTGDTYQVLPGSTQAKDPTVTLVDKNGKMTDTDVYAYVIVHQEDNWFFTGPGTVGTIVNYEIADGWKKLEGYPASEDFVLDPKGLCVTVKAGDMVYYRAVTKEEAKTEAYPILKDNQVRYASKVKSSDLESVTPQLTFQAYAIQKEPFNDPLRAWKQRVPKVMPNKSDIITIDGDKYRVLSVDGPNAFVMSMYDVTGDGMNYRDDNYWHDEQGVYSYAGTKIDNYLNWQWFWSRSSDFCEAVKPTAISQYKYSYSTTKPESESYCEAYLGFDNRMPYYIEENGKLSDVGERNVYLLDVKDVVEYLDGNVTPENVNEMFFGVKEKVRNGCWLRSVNYPDSADGWCIDGKHGSLGFDGDIMSYETRAAFTIDLEMVDFEVYPQSPPKPLEKMPAKGNIIKIDGKEYRVLDAGKTSAFVMSMYDVSEPEAGTIYGDQGGDVRIGDITEKRYAGSTIDDYLENVWYADLDPKIKDKIVSNRIRQNVFRHSWKDNIDSIYRPIYNGKLGFGESQLEFWLGKVASIDVGKRHVYLLDIQDVVDYLGEDNIEPKKVNKMFFNTEGSVDRLCWLRSEYLDNWHDVFCVNGNHGSICGWDTYTQAHEARAAFTIILDGIDFEIVE